LIQCRVVLDIDIFGLKSFQAESGAQSVLALENMPPAAAETMAIVLYQNLGLK